MITQNINVSELKVAKTNVRKSELVGIEELAANIKEVGLIQPLVVRKIGKFHHVVAGQRRLTAIQLINKEQEIIQTVSCQILEGDTANDETISLSENSFTQDMDYVQRCEVYASLVKKGKSIHSIAEAFGTTDHTVKQYLSIGNLSDKFRSLYYADVISGDALMFCTRFNQDEQTKIVEAIEAKKLHPNTYNIKSFMFDSVIKPKYALFDLDNSGIVISQELFTDDKFIADIDAFWKLQYETIETKKADLESKGWEVKVVKPSDNFDLWDYTSGTKKDGATFVFTVDSDGEVKEHKLMLKKSNSSGSTITNITTKTPRQEITVPAQKYYSDWHYQMVRNHLNNDTNDCFTWFVTNLLCGNGISINMSKFSVNEEDTQLSKSQITKNLDALLKKYNDKYSFESSWRNKPINVYKQLSKLKQPELINICNAVLLATLADDTETVEFIGTSNKLNPLDYWKADDSTVATFTSKDSTTAIGVELIEDESQRTLFEGKTLKQRRVDLSANLTSTFLPKYMEFPVSKYGETKLNIERFTM